MKKSKTLFYKQIDGKGYQLDDIYPNKHIALVNAKANREAGNLSRVLKVAEGYAVYVRSL